MGRGRTNKQYMDRMQEIVSLKETLIRDRQFLSSLTNEEFIKYENEIYKIPENFIEKTLKEYGYIKTNNSTIVFERNESIIQNYSSRIDDSY
jgi:hypothetical protein